MRQWLLVVQGRAWPKSAGDVTPTAPTVASSTEEPPLAFHCALALEGEELGHGVPRHE